jgi:hypothetical protein
MDDKIYKSLMTYVFIKSTKGDQEHLQILNFYLKRSTNSSYNLFSESSYEGYSSSQQLP